VLKNNIWSRFLECRLLSALNSSVSASEACSLYLFPFSLWQLNGGIVPFYRFLYYLNPASVEFAEDLPAQTNAIGQVFPMPFGEFKISTTVQKNDLVRPTLCSNRVN